MYIEEYIAKASILMHTLYLLDFVIVHEDINQLDIIL
jgi:hypothetical protein